MLRVHATAPGGWLTVAIPGAVLLVESSPARTPDADALLEALRSGDPIPAALDLLTAGGFSSMPSFALLEYRGQSAHYVVRGGVELSFTGPGGERSATGAGITTWSEQLISGVDGFRAAASGTPAGGGALPLGEGAVWAAHVEYARADASADLAPAEEGLHSASPSRPAEAAPSRAAGAAPSRPAEETILPSEVDEETIVSPLPALAPAEPATAAAAHPSQTVPEESIPFPEGTTGYDHLFGVTQLKSVEAAAVRPQEDDEEPSAQASAAPATVSAPATAPTPVGADGEVDTVGDHDGLTMMSGDIAELRKRALAAEGGDPAGPPAAAERAERGRESSQFALSLPDGRSEPLDRPVIIGRSPSANKVSGSELPRLVTVGGNDPDISRSHVRFTVEGDTVVITDLHSRNGTLISLPGRAPQKLREGEPTSALAGTVVDLGGGVRITVTETSQAAGS